MSRFCSYPLCCIAQSISISLTCWHRPTDPIKPIGQNLFTMTDLCLFICSNPNKYWDPRSLLLLLLLLTLPTICSVSEPVIPTSQIEFPQPFLLFISPLSARPAPISLYSLYYRAINKLLFSLLQTLLFS